MLKKRSVGAAIVLSLITCYIYTLYWIVVVNDEILMVADENGTSGKKVLFFTIITLGIYGIYWTYKMAGLLERKTGEKMVKTCTNKGLYILFYILGVIVTLGFMQNAVNKLIERED